MSDSVRRPVQAHTAQGIVEGQEADGVAAFLGVPYAEAPVGPRRFRAPAPHPGWSGVRPATRLGAPSVQNNLDLPAWVDPSEESEDCLFLNVWAPQDAEPSPVMVWLHGGAFSTGSAGVGLYDGARLAAHGDVVVVSINHRLNVFGYGWFGDLVDELEDHANVGQRDIELALRWVRANIAAFGGDAANVTVFGESGGGAKIATMTATPTAEGLFDKMIVQSGSMTRIADRPSATAVTRLFLTELGLVRPTVEALQAIPAEAVRAAAGAVEASLGPMAFHPVLDGTYVTDLPWTQASLARVADTPMLTGTTSDESLLFGPDLLAVDDAGPAEVVEQLAAFAIAPTLSADVWEDLIARYRQLMPEQSMSSVALSLTNDLSFWGSAIQAAEARRTAGTPAATFVYEFAWQTPCFGAMWSPHASELPFLFGTLTYPTAWDGADDDALRTQDDPDGRRFVLSRSMMTAWATFARTGDPSTPTTPWQPWTGPQGATTLLDASGIHAVGGHRADRWALVESLPRGW